MKIILNEPPCNLHEELQIGNDNIKEFKGLKTQGKALREGASRQDNAENLELRKRKDEASRTKKNDMMNNSGKKKLDYLGETIIRITLCVSFTNLN